MDLRGGAIFDAGPIVRQKEDGEYEMVSIGPTTSMRMEKFEQEFIRRTGVKLIVGKGGMGPSSLGRAFVRETGPPGGRVSVFFSHVPGSGAWLG